MGNFIFCKHLLPTQKMMYVLNGSIQSISIQAPFRSTVHVLFSYFVLLNNDSLEIIEKKFQRMVQIEERSSFFSCNAQQYASTHRQKLYKKFQRMVQIQERPSFYCLNAQQHASTHCK